MIADFLTDLLAKVNSVSGITAEVFYAGMAPEKMDARRVLPVQKVRALFSIQVYMPYKGQQDYVGNQVDTLTALSQTISGKEAPNSQRWQFEGERLVALDQASKQGEDNILRYEQRYSIDLTI